MSAKKNIELARQAIDHQKGLLSFDELAPQAQHYVMLTSYVMADLIMRQPREERKPHFERVPQRFKSSVKSACVEIQKMSVKK